MTKHLIQFDTGIVCHLSIRHEKQMVWFLYIEKKKDEINFRVVEWSEFCGFS